MKNWFAVYLELHAKREPAWMEATFRVTSKRDEDLQRMSSQVLQKYAIFGMKKWAIVPTIVLFAEQKVTAPWFPF